MTYLHRIIGAAGLASSVALAGCAGASSVSSGDPVVELRNSSLRDERRIEGAEQAWRASEGQGPERAALRATLRDIAWDPKQETPVRRKAVDLLVSESDEQAVREARSMVLLMLPKEPSRAMVAHLCQTAVARNWKDAAPSLVRSYARQVAEVPDDQRGERIALTQLFPDRTVGEVVAGMVTSPPETPDVPTPAGQTPINWRERLQLDAWELLARLDSDGSLRAGIARGEIGAGSGETLVVALRACAAELGVVPVTADEVRWLLSMRKEANREWWGQCTTAIGRLSTEQRRGMQLRHAEAVRWASTSRPEWLNASREELLSELAGRLSGRKVRERFRDNEPGAAPPSQRLADSRNALRWGDALQALVIDEALRDRGVIASLFQQAAADRKDTSTEYGGVLRAGQAAEFAAVSFPPRPGQRRGDEHFIASDDMLAMSDTALAHYHFHVQRVSNTEYSGPSREDSRYAARSGRACLVFTSIDDRLLNADYYQPDGIVIDLGDVVLAR